MIQSSTMFKKILFPIFAVSYLFFLSCNSNNHKNTLVVAGSTSVQPFAEGLAEIYTGKNKSVEINIQGGGSSAGIQAAQSGIAEIGMSSRNLKDKEVDKLKPIIIAYDAIAVVVNPSNPVNDMSLEDIRGIFGRKITNWKDLGGEDIEIDAITREDGSGTRGAFQELVMGKENYISNACMVQDSNGSVREMVKADPWAIGYISLGLVNRDVKAIKVGGVFPTLENLKNKEYKFLRPFLFVYSKEPSEEGWKFINFVLSDEGQEFLVKEGLIAVKG